MAPQNAQPVVTGSSVAAAGLASATAALVTSRFGVAGTLIGAALTTMIITGGSAILKSYLEGVTGRVRKMPGQVRAKAGRARNQRFADPERVPARPDLRNNFMGRLRAAFDWFSRLPTLRRRAILAGAIVPAVIAFLISMGAVTGLELAIGNSLPCGIWKKGCPIAADGTVMKDSPLITTLGRPSAEPAPDQQIPGQNVQPRVDPNAQPVDPQQPATPDPAVPDPAVPDPAVPDSGTPAPAEPQVEPVPTPPDPAVPPAEEVPAPSE